MNAETLYAPVAGTIESRIVRYADLVPCLNAFIDTRTPGSETKENFTIIGPGVSENPDQYVHIAEPHGFNIGGARQPPQCMNSQHSHETAEVFVVHSGQWRFDFGENGEDASIEAGPGDIVSFPIHVFRGFTNIGEEVGFLWSVLGGDDPGRVTWAPRVFQLAKDYGLILLENGALVDSLKGEQIPLGVSAMAPTSPSQVAAMRRLTPADGPAHIVRANGSVPDHGLLKTPLIGADAPMAWEHGFDVTRFDFAAGSSSAPTRLAGPEVLFVHAGALDVEIDGEQAHLGADDTLTVPIGTLRSFHAKDGATVFVVHGEGAR